MIQTQESPVKPENNPAESENSVAALPQESLTQKPMPPEFGGRKGPEATRYGDWEMNGKCVDF